MTRLAVAYGASLGALLALAVTLWLADDGDGPCALAWGSIAAILGNVAWGCWG